jgi:hypothetical protein
MIAKFEIFRNNDYRYDFYPPDCQSLDRIKWGFVTLFMIRDIRHLLPLSMRLKLPTRMEFSLSTTEQKNYKTWFFEKDKDGYFTFRIRSSTGVRIVNLGMTTKYFLPYTTQIHYANNPQNSWMTYYKFSKLEKPK